MDPLKERLSLDWLQEARSRRFVPVRPQRSVSLDPNIEDALMAYGRKLLEGVGEQPKKTVHLHDLLRQLQLPLNDALPVVDFLTERNYLQTIKADPVTLNHDLKLTPKGEELIAR